MKDAELLSIGEFGRRARLTAKALRIYDQLGLLSPAVTDASTGYRRYRADQVRTGQLISVLRGAELSLADTGLIVAEIARDVDAATRRLDALLADLAHRHADRQLLIRHVQATLRHGVDPMFPIHMRQVPAQRVLSHPTTPSRTRDRRLRPGSEKGVRRMPRRPGSDRSVHAHLPRRCRLRPRRPPRSRPGLPGGGPTGRSDRGPDRACPRRGVHHHHQGPMGLPSHPGRLRRRRLLAAGRLKAR